MERTGRTGRDDGSATEGRGQNSEEGAEGRGSAQERRGQDGEVECDRREWRAEIVEIYDCEKKSTILLFWVR